MNIVSETTKDTKIKAIPKRNRFGISNSVFMMDTIPEIKCTNSNPVVVKAKYLVEKELELDFWNEISGFFHSNEKSKIQFYDYRTENWEIPTDITIYRRGSVADSYIPISVGDRIIDSNYSVYKVIGFINHDGSSDHYFDIK